jgi:hypothetical protein
MHRADSRNAWGCIAVVTGAIVAVWPFAELAYADDWAYSYAALQLERTGHLVYNGWESAMLVPHIYWGALFIRLFGFSFTCLRISTLPFVAGSVGICYLVMRKLGLQTSAAIFATLLVGLSPVFLPLSVSFMSDDPSLFFTLLSFYAFLRAFDSSGGLSESRGGIMPGRGAWLWLAFGVASGFLGGTDRQVVWVVPLLVLPYLAWLRRRQPRFAATALGAWLVVLIGIVVMTAWFNRQPYTLYQFPFLSEVRLAMSMPAVELKITARTALMLLLLVLPGVLPVAASAVTSTWRGTRFRKVLVGTLLAALMAALLIHPSLASIPWISSTLNWEGINGAAELPGRPIVLIRPVRAIAAVSVYITAILLVGELWDWRNRLSRVFHFFLDPPEAGFPLAAMSLFGVAYLALLMVHAARIDIFDRYFLLVLPWLAALPLLYHQSVRSQKGGESPAMFAAWGLLVIYGIYAIASTQDLMALARARTEATARLEAAGVPRVAIEAGFEYDGWTELLGGGHANHRFVIHPPGAYRPELGLFPSLKPVYRLEYAPVADSIATPFGSVPYVSLLPPFRKQVSIDRIIHP